MPHFIRPTMVGPTYTAEAKCPVCGETAKGDRGKSSVEAKKLARSELQRVSTCSPHPEFVSDDTPRGVALRFDGLGGLRRCHPSGAEVFAVGIGPLSPGATPPIVCFGDLEPFDRSEPKRRKGVAAFACGHERLVARFRRKRSRVQVAVGKPTRLHGDPLRPIPPVKKVKEKGAKS
jgi:hypothetical protein